MEFKNFRPFAPLRETRSLADNSQDSWLPDWLHDPLLTIPPTKWQYESLKDPDGKGTWQSFHFATRVKMDGAAYFCGKVLGATSMPDGIGLDLLAHREKLWYLDAFFMELMAAYECLLQELNVVYGAGLAIGGVRWPIMKKRVPETMFKHFESCHESEWFGKVKRYRNWSVHRMYQVGTSTTSYPLTWTSDDHRIEIALYNDKSCTFETEDVRNIQGYLGKMVIFVNRSWGLMSDQFESTPESDK